MVVNSDDVSKEASQTPGNSENSPLGNEGRNTLVTEANANVEAHFSSTMLLQMRTLIEGVIDGAMDKKLHALWMNPKGSDAQLDVHEGGGSKSTPGAYKQKHKNSSVIQELVTKLPLMTTVEKEGFLTDWESPEVENLKECINEPKEGAIDA